MSEGVPKRSVAFENTSDTESNGTGNLNGGGSGRKYRTMENNTRSRSYIAPPGQRQRRPSLVPVNSSISMYSVPTMHVSDNGARSDRDNRVAAGLTGALKFKGLLNVRLRARRERLGGNNTPGQDSVTPDYLNQDIPLLNPDSAPPAGLQNDYGSMRTVDLSATGSILQKHGYIINKTVETDYLAIREYILGNKVCICLLCIPLGVLASVLGWGDQAVFLFNFFAILPLAQLLGDFTEEVALYTNDTIGGLLNATLGNATELIISIFAIRKGLLRVVQVSLLGSVLSNELLVTGCCFLFGGFYHSEQHFNTHIAAIDSSLLLMAVLGLTIPAAFSSTVASDCKVPCKVESITTISHVTALMLFFLYGMLLLFQLHTHTHIMNVTAEDGIDDDSASQAAAVVHYEDNQSRTSQGDPAENYNGQNLQVDTSAPRRPSISINPPPSPSPNTGGSDSRRRMYLDLHQSGETMSTHMVDIDDEQDPEEATMTLRAAIFMLGVTTLLVAICSELLVDSIEDVSVSWGLSEVFIGLILLPIIGNAAEHATAITVAIKGKMDLALGVALGSSVQIALCVVPALCLVGWAVDKPLTLDFHPFETIVLVVSVLVVTSTVRQGTSTWLEGIMLIISYCIIAVAYFYRNEPPASVPAPEPECVCGEPCCFA
mmetsp:Transcript_16306/g.31636  ORF Transcript_16306/g.31636 Transcript_16306/m.31636 type:complete len:659 (-) Transcript_16306:515-2491(-)|eukprot:CAMPEP_0171493276 /NCGR_PEP_ID=MMETSP0958-20121227/4875_1 /TAXON_ID=87120 /ORGANISM="Aurantiochytrium limacinum, Strain ATCCMYA-1381" /LENGTH=658 /DNA_ID=CAMNT_0012026887 /DNA_START=1106 /DNA_END=3082 /DNA_ORIENTATION=+